MYTSNIPIKLIIFISIFTNILVFFLIGNFFWWLSKSGNKT